MKQIQIIDDTVFWHLNKTPITPLRQSVETDVVVVGGGMAGLTTAQAFAEKGARVVLLEKNFCGAGASGKSSGFITPNSELSLHDLSVLYGLEEAHKLWNFVVSGVAHIRKNILDYKIDCEYQPHDSLVVANSTRAFKKIIATEYAVRQKLGYESALYETADTLTAVIGSSHYVGGIAYADSFSIHAYQYCQAMKQILKQKGVQIYEDTPVTEIKDNHVTTSHAQVKVQHIVVCVDRFLPDLGSLTKEVYHAQTSLLLSSPLTDAQIATLFPGKPYIVWDTELIYTYFRLTRDKRLLVGGSNLLTTYASREKHYNRHVIKKLQNYWHQKFPLVPVTFEYVWPGLIGISKDILPIAGHDKTMASVYYIAAAAGLPWAAALGNQSVAAILNGDHSFDVYFSPYRSFPIGSTLQTILGTKLTFALSNFMRTGSF
jgi:gamma-glutamylputrescine oxidase